MRRASKDCRLKNTTTLKMNFTQASLRQVVLSHADLVMSLLKAACLQIRSVNSIDKTLEARHHQDVLKRGSKAILKSKEQTSHQNVTVKINLTSRSARKAVTKWKKLRLKTPSQLSHTRSQL